MIVDDLLQALRDLCKEDAHDKKMFDYWVSLGVTAKKMIEAGEISEIDEADEAMIKRIQIKRNEEYDNE